VEPVPLCHPVVGNPAHLAEEPNRDHSQDFSALGALRSHPRRDSDNDTLLRQKVDPVQAVQVNARNDKLT
jgi:hypothetical protein